MADEAPHLVDLEKLATQFRERSASIPLAQMTRLAPQLRLIEGHADCILQGVECTHGRGCIRLRTQAELILTCQRCLGPMPWQVRTDTRLVLIEVPEEMERIPDEYEAVLLGEARVRTLELVEDELILALPLIALHEQADCATAVDARGGVEVAGSDSNRPFAALGEMIKGS